MDSAIAALIGSLGGALVGSGGAYFIARANQKAARQLAADDALRKWRGELVRPLLERAGRVYGLLSLWAAAQSMGNAADIQSAMDNLMKEGALMADTSYDAVLDIDFRAAVEELKEAGLQCTLLIMSPPVPPPNDPKMKQAFERVRVASADLNRAAEAYIYRLQ